MHDESEPDLKFLKGLQIVHIGLTAGAFITGVVLFLVAEFAMQGKLVNLGMPLFSYIACGALVVSGSLALVVPETAAKAAIQANRKQGMEKALVAGFGAGMMVACALLEGVVIFALIAYLMEREWLALVVAGVAWILLLSQFPTRSGTSNWMERHRYLAEPDGA